VLDLILIAVFAGYTASFACVVLERRLEGRKPDGRSTCVCGTPIPMYRNIPVVTWLLQRGRARCCAARIPFWYFGAEASTSAAALLGAWATSPRPWWGGIAGTALAMALLVGWHRHRHRHTSLDRG
jgi:prepilin signal peptidase PulO-like enzyme (type II secretory pathway)